MIRVTDHIYVPLAVMGRHDENTWYGYVYDGSRYVVMHHRRVNWVIDLVRQLALVGMNEKKS